MPDRPSLRPISEEMEDLLGVRHPVLDHGFVELVDYMGTDHCIVQAARTSYAKGTRSHRDDRGLIRYLMRKRHTSPFEQAEIKLLVKLPIFVARQWVRTRTANVNERSARYSILDREFYVPAPEVMCAQSTTNKQGREEPISADMAGTMTRLMREQAVDAFDLYALLLNDDGSGESVGDVPQLTRELARTVLPLSTYTTWVWKIDLHNLLHFLSLRFDSHAQHEIRVYAEVISKMVAAWCPLVWEAFEDYRLHARTFSRHELAVLRELLAGVPDVDATLDTMIAARVSAGELSAREARELRDALRPEVSDG